MCSDIITPKDGINIEPIEQLDDENRVGVVDATPGGETVTYEDARQAFGFVRKRRGSWEIGDEESTIFISSDGRELSVSYGPEFTPIETSIRQGLYQIAIQQFEGYYPQFDLMFDDSGLVVFVQEDTQVAVAPVQYPWDAPSTECAPSGPRGPTVQ